MKARILLIGAIALLTCTAAPAANATKADTPAPRPMKQLMKDLGSDSWRVRLDAGMEIGLIGADAAPAVIEALSDKNRHLRRGACDALIAIRKSTPGDTREQTAEKAAPTKPAIKTLLKMMTEDPDPWVQTGAAEALRSFGKEARTELGADLAKTLAKVLISKDSDLWLRREALNTLRSSGAEADMDIKAKVRIYTEAAQFMDIMFRGGSLKKLGEFGPAAAPAVPVLMKFVEKYYLRGADARAGICATQALGNIGAPAKPALGVLRKLAKDGPQGLILEYKAGSGDLGKKDATEAIAKIEAALKEAK